MGLVPRVYGRLHWDKTLHTSPLFVKAEGGTVTIGGTVPNEEAKAKVISLTKDTFGVTRVIIHLNIAAPSAETTAPRPTIQPKTTVEPTTPPERD
jgi:BON domain